MGTPTRPICADTSYTTPNCTDYLSMVTSKNGTYTVKMINNNQKKKKAPDPGNGLVSKNYTDERLI